MEYAALRHRLTDAERNVSRSRRADQRAEVVESLQALRPGDVVEVPSGRFSGLVVVIDPGLDDREGPRPYVLTADRHARRLSLTDFSTPVTAVTRLRIPKNFNGRNPQARRDLANTLRHRTHDLDVAPSRRGRTTAGEDPRVAELRAALRAHPCHQCPDREDHARWAERWFKLDRDAATLRRRIEQRTNTIARQFDRVCEVLTALDYLEDGGRRVTERGRTLMRIYHEMDLLVAEALREGLLDGLDASALASVLAAVVYEARRPDDVHPRVPSGRVREVLGRLVSLWGELDRLEKDHHLDQLREPDLGFSWAAWRWAEGDELDEVLEASGLAAGDFVRWMKQLLDLVDQVADAAAGTGLRRIARDTASRLRRGVVAYSSAVTD
jgi:ATP-dependent RNA helicase HelY